MARITIEDCLKGIDAFELVVLSAQRTKEIEGGAFIALPRNNDKDTVVSLREMAEGLVEGERLKEAFMDRFRRQSFLESEESLSLEDAQEVSKELSVTQEDATYIASIESPESKDADAS